MSFRCLSIFHNWKYGEYDGNGWFKCTKCQKLKQCKKCISCNLIWAAGIGADVVYCKICGANQ